MTSAIVLGGSRGIGRAISKKFASRGMKVVLAARDENQLKRVKQEIEKLNKGKALMIPTDVTKELEIKNLVQKTLDRFGTIDVLVNNAGIGIFNRIDDFSVDEYEQIFNVNVKGVFLLTKYVIPHMINKRSTI